MSSPRIRRVNSTKEAETVRDDFITQGYSVKSGGEASTLMHKSSWGSVGTHVVILVFTFWSFGFCNLIYAVAAHKSDEVLIKVGE